MAAPISVSGTTCAFSQNDFLCKIVTARQLQQEMVAKSCFSFTTAIMIARDDNDLARTTSGREHRVNFRFLNSIQKNSRLSMPAHSSGLHSKMVRQLPNYVDRELVDKFQKLTGHNPADFA